MIQGYDVSNYQAEHFPLKDSRNDKPIDFVFVKVTEGLSYINPKWKAQRDWARSHGLAVGYYHYPHMANNPKVEADHFLAQLDLRQGELIVLDWEGYDAANRTVLKSRQLVYRDVWLPYVKAKQPAHKVGMYCNTDYWLNVDKTQNTGDFLWIATGGKAAGQPGIQYDWKFHQYSTADNLDHDVAAFDSRAALFVWSGAKEEYVALTKADVVTLAKQDDVIKSPDSALATATNKFWTLETYLYETYRTARDGKTAADSALVTAASVKKAVADLSKKVDALPSGGIDLDALAKKVADLLAARLAD